MSLDSEIIESLKRLARSQSSPPDFLCTVDSVNLTDMTCYCIPVNGDADMKDVRLIAQNDPGFLIVPKVGSVVGVSILDSGTGYVSMTSEVSEIRLNGQSFGGIVKIDAQTIKLNQLVTQIQAQLALISTGLAGVGGVYTPGLLSTFSKTDYENTTVSHGNGT